MKNPGDVVWFRNPFAGKGKHHLCVNVGGRYLYLSSVRHGQKTYTDAFRYSCSETPFLPDTETGEAKVSCSTVLSMSDNDLKVYGAKHKGRVTKEFMMNVYEFVETCDAIADEDRETILSGLDDWL